MIVEDFRCFCEPCENRTQDSYRLEATCLNCGIRFQAIMRHGDKHPHDADCPACGVARTSWGSLVPEFEYEPVGEGEK